MKGCEVIAEWAEPIRNHFWHIAETCNGDVEKLKVLLSYILYFYEELSFFCLLFAMY